MSGGPLRLPSGPWRAASGFACELPRSHSSGFATSDNIAAIHPDGETCYLIWSRRLFAFRTATGRALEVPPGVKGHQMILSPAGDRLVTADWGGAGPDPVRLYAVSLSSGRGTVERREWLAGELPHLA